MLNLKKFYQKTFRKLKRVGKSKPKSKRNRRTPAQNPENIFNIAIEPIKKRRKQTKTKTNKKIKNACYQEAVLNSVLLYL